MRTPIFQLDAFTTRRFAGNPAAVMPMDSFPADAVLQAIAAENNLAETAFLVPEGGDYRLRWFTPAVEVPLCGHATLASAAVVMERLEPARSSVVFHSASGPLKVNRRMRATSWISRRDRPNQSRHHRSSPKRWASLQLRFSSTPSITWLCSRNAQVLPELAPDMAALTRMDRPGVIVTAHGGGIYDFVSRYFAQPRASPKSRDRRGALHAGALLGQTTGQDCVSRLPGLAPRRRNHLPVGRRSRRTGRLLRFLPRRHGGYLMWRSRNLLDIASEGSANLLPRCGFAFELGVDCGVGADFVVPAPGPELDGEIVGIDLGHAASAHHNLAKDIVADRDQAAP
jgi:hypothetical protein